MTRYVTFTTDGQAVGGRGPTVAARVAAGRVGQYLAPDITQAILDGRQPSDLTAEKLLEHSRLPLAWHDQRIVLGFA